MGGFLLLSVSVCRKVTFTVGPVEGAGGDQPPIEVTKTICKFVSVALPVSDCLGEVDPETGECGGGGPGEGGYDYPDTPEPDDPCEIAAANNAKAKQLLLETKIAAAEEQVTSTLSTDTNEKSFSFGKDANGNYDTTAIKIATAGNQVGIQVNNPNLSVEGGGHTHTIDLYNCFSAGDIYSFQGANVINPNFKTLLVFANGGVVYALTITDPVKYANFVGAHSAGNNLDMSTSHWKESSPIYTDFENAMGQFINQGFSEDDALANATAMVINKYDMGITLSQRDSFNNFNPIFVNETIIPMNIGGILLPVSIFNQTTNCNLN